MIEHVRDGDPDQPVSPQGQQGSRLLISSDTFKQGQDVR